jgi:hypothetical protein
VTRNTGGFWAKNEFSPPFPEFKGFKAALNEESEGDEREVSQFDEKSRAVLKPEILNRKTSPQKEFSQDTLLAFKEYRPPEKAQWLI